MSLQSDEERYLVQMIEMIQREYLKAVEPYVQRLVAIRRMELRTVVIYPDDGPPELKEVLHCKLLEEPK